jgi:hypothetical protein
MLMVLIPLLLLRLSKGIWHIPVELAIRVGDVGFLPAFALCAAKALKGYQPTGQYFEKPKWTIGSVATGYAAISCVEGFALATNVIDWKHELRPDHAWHSLMLGLLFYTFSTTVMALSTMWNTQRRWVAWAYVFMVGYLGTFVAYYTPLQDITFGRTNP